MSDVKAELKAAREAIEKKDWKEALRHCTSAIKIDKKNYNVWLIAGKCFSQLLQEPQQGQQTNAQKAEQAYRSAIELDKANPLAWKGLAELFEKTNDTNKLIDVYKELISFHNNDNVKQREYKVKLTETFKKLNMFLESIQGYQALLAESTDPKEKSSIWNTIVDLHEQQEANIQKIEAQKRFQAYLTKTRKTAVKGSKAPAPKPMNDGTLIVSEEEAQVLKEIEQTVANERNLADLTLFKVYEEVIFSDVALPNILDIISKYVKWIQTSRDLYSAQGNAEKAQQVRKQLVDHCLKISTIHPNAYVCLEVLIALQEEDQKDFSPKDILRMVQKYTHLAPQKSFGWLYVGSQVAQTIYNVISDHKQNDPNNAIWKYKNINYANTNKDTRDQVLFNINEEARALITKGLKTYTDSLSGWISLTNLLILNSSYQSVIECVNKALGFLSKKASGTVKFDRAYVALQLNQATALKALKKTDNAIDLLKQILATEAYKNSTDVMMGLGDLYYDITKYQEAHEWFSKVLTHEPQNDKALFRVAQCHYQLGNFQSSKEQLLTCLKINPARFEYHHWLGRTYWELGGEFRSQKQYAQTSFLQSAKLNPDFAANFTYLGHYYRIIENDMDKAKRCYQKAFGLDPLDEQAGTSLSDMYISQQQFTLALSVYKEVTSRSNRVKWAWMRLAIYQQTNNQLDESVISFQNALRGDPDDALCWQGLAETYRRQGKYMAALKSFTRAIQLNDKLNYAQYQVASLQSLLGLVENSVAQYQSALQHNQNYLPALKGLSESYLSLAVEQLNGNFYAQSIQSLDRGIDTCRQAIAIQGDVICLHKLLGDCYTMYYHMPAANLKKSFAQKFELIGKGIEGYNTAMTLANANTEMQYQVPSLLADIATNYFYQAKVLTNVADSEMKDKSSKIQDCLNKARESVKQALCYSPNSSVFWCLLGILERTPQHQQHCFLKSIQADNKNFIAWANLGMLYLQHTKIEEAHKAFEQAMRLNTNAVNAWLGNAILQEYMSSSVNSIKKANKLYRQATAITFDKRQIGYRNLIYVGLGYTSLYLGDYTTTEHALANYLYNFPQDGGAHNLYGLALEQQGLLQLASKEFTEARNSIQAEPEGGAAQNNPATLGNAESQPLRQSKLSSVDQNALRVRANLPHPEDTKADNAPQDSQSLCCMALIAWKSKKEGQALQLLEAALKVSPNEDITKNIVICIALLHYNLNKEDKAKQYIKQCTTKYNSDPRVLTVSVAFHVATKDYSSAVTCLTQLQKMLPVDLTQHSIQLITLETQTHLLEGNYEAALRTVSRGLHSFPTELSLWNKLNQIILKSSSTSEQEYFSSALVFSVSRTLSSNLCHQTPNFQKSQELLKIGRSYDEVLEHEDEISLRYRQISHSILMFGKNQYLSTTVAASTAISYIQHAIHINPTPSNTYYLLAMSAYTNAMRSNIGPHWKSAKAALTLAEKKLAQNPVKHDTDDTYRLFMRLAIAEAALYLGSAQESITLTQSILKDIASAQVPKSIASYLSSIASQQLARCELATIVSKASKNPDFTPALKLYNQAIKIDPINAAAWHELAVLYQSLGKANASELCLRQCIQTVDHYYYANVSHGSASTMTDHLTAHSLLTMKFTTLLRLTHHLMLNKQYTAAVDTIEEALQLFPESAVALCMKGILLFKTGDAQNAEMTLQQSITIDSKLPLTNYYLSLVHFQAQDFETAESDLYYERDNNPQSDIALYQLGRVISMMNRSEAASVLLQKAVHINPANQQFFAILKELSKPK